MLNPVKQSIKNPPKIIVVALYFLACQLAYHDPKAKPKATAPCTYPKVSAENRSGWIKTKGIIAV